jgi:DNA-binding transcriptional ArsR family regulator
MEQLLWYLLAGSRGGYNRIRIIEALNERPYNANQLAERLGLDYRTIRHHLDLLVKNNVLARPAGDAYGAMYFLSGTLKANLETFELIRRSASPPPGEIMAKGDNLSREVE